MASWETWGPGCGQLFLEPKGTTLALVRGDTSAALRVCRVPGKYFLGGAYGYRNCTILGCITKCVGLRRI